LNQIPSSGISGNHNRRTNPAFPYFLYLQGTQKIGEIPMKYG